MPRFEGVAARRAEWAERIRRPSVATRRPRRGPDATAHHAAELTLADRIELLVGLGVFAALDPGAVRDLAERCALERFAPGAIVFAEGDVGDRVIVVADGRAELSTAGASGEVPLATLERGELVGELALLAAPDRRRNATLTASTPLTVLSLAADDLARVLDADPRVREAFAARVEEITVARFIKHVGPFMTLDDQARRRLAQRLTPRAVTAGETLMRQGEPGDRCYLLRAGTVDVLHDAGEGDRVVADMGPGSIVGETAMLTDAPRSATVRARTDCDLLEMRRDDLVSVLGADAAAGQELIRLLRSRERPRRRADVESIESRNAAGETITVLKNRAEGTYFRLSESGRFVWERLDGRHNLRDLTFDVFRAFHRFAPDDVAEIISGLAQARMIERASLKGDVGETAAAGGPAAKVLAGARRLLDLQASVRGLDARLTRMYDGGVRRLYTRPAQVLLAALAVAGVVAFVLTAGTAHGALSGGHAAIILLVEPAYFLSVLLHEAAHAFTVKAFGREVNRAGVGWYWFGPMAFVDTSDMWLAGPRERILVSLAGPYSNVLFAAVASIAALFAGDPTVTATLWCIALPSYVMALVNLNPLLELDGYHVLTDLIDRPNLRPEALRWVGANARAAVRDRARLRAHRIEAVYASAAVLYVLVMAVMTVVLYRLTVQGWVSSVLPQAVAQATAWVLAGVGVAVVSLGLLAELRHTAEPSRL
jgi:putative peptide zinc metalloprotease protein